MSHGHLKFAATKSKKKALGDRGREIVKYLLSKPGAQLTLARDDGKRILVIAGNHEQFKRWCRERDINPKLCIYLSRPEILYGFNPRHITQVVETGEHWNNESMKDPDVRNRVEFIKRVVKEQL